MSYVILRTNKIKNKVSFIHRLKHDFRLSSVPNANRCISNDYMNFDITNVIKKYENNFDNENSAFKKRRKDAVVAIDYLIAASPTFFKNSNQETINNYFKEALAFIEKKHGIHNILYSVRHNDETSPHLHIIVIPEFKGKLNCKEFLGSAKKLIKMQTDFAEQVGSKFGLKRGIQNKPVKHNTLKAFYAKTAQMNDVLLKLHSENKVLQNEQQFIQNYLKNKINILEKKYEDSRRINQRIRSMGSYADGRQQATDNLQNNEARPRIINSNAYGRSYKAIATAIEETAQSINRQHITTTIESATTYLQNVATATTRAIQDVTHKQVINKFKPKL